MFDMGICIDFAAIIFENLLLHTQEVTGSSPAVSTSKESLENVQFSRDSLFIPHFSSIFHVFILRHGFNNYQIVSL